MKIKSILIASLVVVSAYGASAPVKPLLKSDIVKKTTIEGQAFLKTAGGDIKTCAGEFVVLYTKDDYRKLAMKRTFESFISALGMSRYFGESYEKDNKSYKSNRAYAGVVDSGLDRIYDEIKKLQRRYPQLNIRKGYQKDTFNEDLDKALQYETEEIAKLGIISKPILESQCDASGNFSFKNAPFGNYGIVTSVTWQVMTSATQQIGGSRQGGELGKEVTIDDTLQKVFITEYFPKAI